MNVGGDLRAEGMAPEGSGWVVAVTDPNHPDRIVRNSTALAGDRLILTKPLGAGIAATAIKADMAGYKMIHG